METTYGYNNGLYWGYIGIMEKKMETTMVYWDYIGVIWVVVKIMVPFWVPIIIRHLIFRVPKKGP